MNNYRFGYSHVQEDGYISATHKHECYEIIYYRSCSGVTEIGEKTYKFQKGTIALIYPNEFHSEVHVTGGKLSFIGFDTDFTDFPPQGVYTANDDKIYVLLKEILSEVKMQQRNYEMMLSAKISQILVELSRYSKDSGNTLKDISYIKNHIDENYSMKMNLNLLAGSCGYSYSALRHKFKALYGYSPQNYLVKVRLENAYELLQTGEFNCTEVCYRCGFSNSSQFTRMFKQKYGVSPKEIIRRSGE